MKKISPLKYLLVSIIFCLLHGIEVEANIFYLPQDSCQNQSKSTLKKPYVKKIKDTLKFSVWYIDGSYIRANLDIEFTNFGHHYDFEFIPDNELWIDNENSPGESDYFITHMLVSYNLMSKGMDYDSALVIADSVEKNERMKSTLTLEILKLRQDQNNDSEVIKRIHKSFLKSFSKYLNVWVVNGEIVRNIYFIDFTEGGHNKVYNFIPDNEVWIDDDIFPDERKFVLLHEMHERYLMSKGVSYDNAHQESSSLEYFCRLNPGKLERKLKIELNRKY
jgi:hypothetical protein